jgi:two-component system KDP operon response regulator KdpE
MKPLALIVDDEKSISRFIKVSLEAESYRCLQAQGGAEAISLIASQQPDIVLLDLGLPDIDGMDVIRRVREWSDVPVIVVSARGQEREKVEALDAGADDYMTKPFGSAELQARIRAALRRKGAESNGEESVVTLGELQIDPANRRVLLQGKAIHLTPTEYRLLTQLARYRGRVLTHSFLIREIWGAGMPEDTQSLRVCMGNLRRKIETDPAAPRYLLTEVGVGYRMADE